MASKRRLIVCCDGTWQDLERPYPTNVVKLSQGVKAVGGDKAAGDEEVSQILFYDGGIGTKQINTENSLIDELTRIGGGVIGAGIDNKILTAYRFLCLNYQPGDEIFLFGFSRGAYTVRCLAGLIYNSGLPEPKNLRRIPEAYEIYRDKQDPRKAPSGEDAINFRKQYGERPAIKALCCWDTVSALGLPNILPGIKLAENFNERYRFYDCTINPTIEHAFHAVSIDEPRKAFNVTLMESHRSKPDQVTQVWFPGGHGAVGGGAREERGLSDGALEWMIGKVEALGLEIDKSAIEDGIVPNPATPYKQPEGFTMLAGTITREFKGSFQDLHTSVKQRWKQLDNYRPKNLKDFIKDLDAWFDH